MGFSLNASSVASLAQGLLTATMAVMLYRGARTAARRALARAQAFLALYAAFVFVTFSTVGLVAAVANLVALFFGILAARDLAAYADWLARGGHADERPGLPRWVDVAAIGVGLVACVAGGPLAVVDRARAYVVATMVENLVILALFVRVFAALRGAAQKRVAGAKTMARACFWPVLAIVTNLAMNQMAIRGVAVPRAAYFLLRDLSLLVFAFGLLAVYLDHGHEPMSLRARLVAGTTTIVAALVTVAAHVLEPWVVWLSGAGASADAKDALAWRLIALFSAGVVGVFTFVPRLFKTNVLEPLEALVGAIETVEKGGTTSLPVGRHDELGRLTQSFNTMSRGLGESRSALESKIHELEERQREVETLNQELRHQIASRSRHIAQDLGSATVTAGTSTGEMVGDRYRVVRALGRGATGEVHEVERVADGKRVALKMLTAGASSTDALRLAREAEIAATVSHENLVSVFDVGLHASRVYIVMELMLGGSLEDARPRFGAPGFALPVLLDVARGLAALHARDIVHRDLKPSNVLIEESEGTVRVKIADFGISRLAAADPAADTIPTAVSAPAGLALTQTGLMMGTLLYMPAELLGGAAFVRPPVDVFAFGVLAFEVLAGRVPFQDDDFHALMKKHATAPPPPLRELRPDTPPALVEVVESCLEKCPTDRPPAMEMILWELRRANRPS